ncbi:YoaK family protein [Fusobacterium sp.]|uniref:YoaK family protein n=1 Tax=Fusobacterium sp. TaxID=68766 RepID=UPI00262EBE35|nr:YoaK family protein [Fusobacterium sp.]
MGSKIMLIWICMLSFIGGYVDVYGLITVAFPLTHFTGSVAKLAMEGCEIRIDKEVFQLAVALFFFMLGNILAGLFIGERHFSLRKRYGLIFMILGTFIALIFHLAHGNKSFAYLLSIAVGVQNGLFITYKGILVRTSHLTGALSDLGVYIGYLLRGKQFDTWKIFYYTLSLFSFFFGGVISKVMYDIYGKESVYAVSLGYILIGASYLCLRKKLERNIEYEEVKAERAKRHNFNEKVKKYNKHHHEVCTK